MIVESGLGARLEGDFSPSLGLPFSLKRGLLVISALGRKARDSGPRVGSPLAALGLPLMVALSTGRGGQVCVP
jgi:hypothetical protein